MSSFTKLEILSVPRHALLANLHNRRADEAYVHSRNLVVSWQASQLIAKLGSTLQVETRAPSIYNLLQKCGDDEGMPPEICRLDACRANGLIQQSQAQFQLSEVPCDAITAFLGEQQRTDRKLRLESTVPELPLHGSVIFIRIWKIEPCGIRYVAG